MYPVEQVTYVIRLIIENGPVTIRKSIKDDNQGVVNVGHGYARARLTSIFRALNLTDRGQWQQRLHHQMMLCWVDCNFDRVVDPDPRRFEYKFRLHENKSDASALERSLLWAYKIEFGDLPICNLKTY